MLWTLPRSDPAALPCHAHTSARFTRSGKAPLPCGSVARMLLAPGLCRGLAHRRRAPPGGAALHTAACRRAMRHRPFSLRGKATMIWFMPRANPGALSEYLRPNRCGVSASAGKLPHGPLPRLLMLWMYAELGRARHNAPLDLVYSLSDYLLALEVPDTLDLVEQAERLFACRFHAGEHEMALTEPSTIRWVAEHDSLGDIAPLRATGVELGQAMRDELAIGALPHPRRAPRAPSDPGRGPCVRARVPRRPRPPRTAQGGSGPGRARRRRPFLLTEPTVFQPPASSSIASLLPGVQRSEKTRIFSDNIVIWNCMRS